MSEEPAITLTQFKVITEDFRSDVKRMNEVIIHRLDQQGGDITALKEQVALILEGQTEIKAELRHKVSNDDFEKLEKRVTRLETKAA